MKRAAIALWQTFDDTFGYATGKIDRIKDIENIRDNTAYMVAMFDSGNRRRLLGLCNNADAKAFVQRCIDTEIAALMGG